MPQYSVFSIQSSLFQFKVHHTYNNKFFQATNTLHWTEGAIQPLIRGPHGKTLPHGMTPFVIFCFGSIPKLNHNWPFQTDSKGLFFIFSNSIPFFIHQYVNSTYHCTFSEQLSKIANQLSLVNKSVNICLNSNEIFLQ